MSQMSIYLMLAFCICAMACSHYPKQHPIEVDEKGRVLKSFDGELIKHYDTLGRMTEFYGFVNRDDWYGCVHDKIFYNERGQEIRRILYQFSESDTICRITDSMDHLEYKNYYSPTGELLNREIYSPVKRNGKVIRYRLYVPNEPEEGEN